MFFSESEQRHLEVSMKLNGYKEFTHAFFDTKDFINYKNLILNNIETSEDSRLILPGKKFSDILNAGKYVIDKHTNGADIRIPCSNNDVLLADIKALYGESFDKDKYDEICKYVTDNCDLKKVTDLTVNYEDGDVFGNGHSASNYYFSLDEVDIEFYENFPIINIDLFLSGKSNDLLKTIYVHEMYHALINRHKGNIRNCLNVEFLSIFMEFVAALDLDSSTELLDLAILKRLIWNKYDILSRELSILNNANPLEVITANTYLLSSLQAFALLNTYKKSSNKVKKEIDRDINKVITGNGIIEDVIDKYEAAPERGVRVAKTYVKKLF